MNNQETILELQELNSELGALATRATYTVPSGYFEGFAASVFARIKMLETEEAGMFLNTLSKEVPYSVPAGYFDTLAENVMAAIHLEQGYQTADEELSSLSPLLSSIGKTNPYKTPAGYFENLGNNINLKSAAKPVAKTVSMVSRKWFRYAAAAVVIGFVAITGLQYFDRNGTSISHPVESIDLKNVSTADINNFIQITDESVADQSKSTSSAKTDVKDLLQDVSDKDIQDFLSKTSSGNDETDADILLN